MPEREEAVTRDLADAPVRARPDPSLDPLPRRDDVFPFDERHVNLTKLDELRAERGLSRYKMLVWLLRGGVLLAEDVE